MVKNLFYNKSKFSHLFEFEEGEEKRQGVYFLLLTFVIYLPLPGPGV